MYRILALIVLLFISGCARSGIKYATKLDDNPYRMFGKEPSRVFYFSENISDSLVTKWESEAYGGFTNSSISAYEDLVFINDLAGRIFCYNIETGKRIGYLKYSSGSVFSTPVPFRSKVIFPVALEKDNLTELIIYDYNIGKELEDIELPGRVLTQMLVVDDDILFTTEVGIAYRFDSNGRKKWETHTRTPTRSSPVLINNLFIFGNDKGEIIALDATNGDSVYVRKIDGHFFSGLTVSDQIIYAGNDNGKVYALNANNGDIIWEFDTGLRIKMEAAVDEQNVYIGNLNGSFFAINKKSGELNWKTKLVGILNVTPLVTSNMIILPNVLFSFHLLDKETGVVKKTIKLDGRAKLSPVIHRNTLFIGFDDGVIRAYEFVY